MRQQQQVVRFRFDRHEDAGTPGVLPIKLGDEYTTCVAQREGERNSYLFKVKHRLYHNTADKEPICRFYS